MITAYHLFKSKLLGPKQYSIIITTEKSLKKLLIPELIAANIRTEYEYYTRLLTYMQSHWALKFLLHHWNKPCKWMKCTLL